MTYAALLHEESEPPALSSTVSYAELHQNSLCTQHPRPRTPPESKIQFKFAIKTLEH
jgi:hypothetical protein